MVLSEFMVMVSNDVPSTLGYSGSLKDGGPPGPALPPLLLRDCASTCPGEKEGSLTNTRGRGRVPRGVAVVKDKK